MPFTCVAVVVGPVSTAIPSDILLTAGVNSPSSVLSCCAERLSSITARTLRSFDSDLRWEWVASDDVKGTECRLLTAGGDADGEITVADVVGDRGGDVVTLAQAAEVSGKKPPAELLHEFFPSLLLSSSGVDEVRGLGLADGVFAITERGGSIEKILSSAGGGP